MLATLLFAGGTVGVALVALVVVGHPVAPLVVVLVAVAGFGVAKAAGWAGARGRLTRATARWLVDRAGFNGHGGGGGTPAAFGRPRVFGVAVREGQPALAVVSHPARRRSGFRRLVGDGPAMTAVIGLEGVTRGIAPPAVEERAAAAFGQFLTGLADPGIPVDQVDLITRVFPASTDGFEAWAAEGPASRSGGSLAEAAGLVTGLASGHRSFLVARMPVGSLAERARSDLGGADRESVLEQARVTAGEVARRAKDAGLAPAWGLTRGLLRAVVAHSFTPSTGIDRVVEGPGLPAPAFRLSGDGRALVADGPDGVSWWHSVVTVDPDGWPAEPVGADVLDRLVTGLPAAPVRTVVAQFPLVERGRAIERARGASALATANRISAQSKGQVSTGVDERHEDLGAWLLQDLTEFGAAGVLPVLRVMVSAGSASGIREARAAVETRFHELGFWGLDWRVGDQGRAVAACLPLGLGVRGL
ncbi:MAG: hypothetical protein LBJ44_11985 [Propionibacteriaceae bacterium]|jgi:hypothetical protein|nr:hypothetical protein [Propionibacteriaceae bacterium]